MTSQQWWCASSTIKILPEVRAKLNDNGDSWTLGRVENVVEIIPMQGRAGSFMTTTV